MRYFLIILLFLCQTANAQLKLLKDINHMFDGSASGITPENLIDINGTLYFSGQGPAGRELWKSDGTIAGTVMVKDIYAGPESSYPSDFVKLGGTLYFLAADGSHGKELWRSDGTAEGTIMVADITPSSKDVQSDLSNIQGLKVRGNRLYFTLLGDGDLWASDGTTVGTEIICKNVTNSPEYFDIYAINGYAYFVYSPAFNDTRWMKTDGTAAGTTLFKQIAYNQSLANHFREMNGAVYLIFSDGVTGSELWKTDGTVAGTVLVKDIIPGPNGSSPYDFIVMNGQLFFTIKNNNSTETWKSDGTAAGTTKVANTGYWNSAVAGTDRLYFTKQFLVSYHYETELWRTDGTEAGTTFIRRFTTALSNGGGIYSSRPMLATIGNTVYFATAPDGSSDYQLWKSDGTVAGTSMLTMMTYNNGVNPQATHSPHNLTACGGQLFFCSSTSKQGNELWKTDGTTAGTTMISDMPEGSVYSAAEGFTKLNNLVIFAAGDENGGLEPWRTDGTTEGTFMLKDIFPGPPPLYSSQPNNFTFFKGYVYFAANAGTDLGGRGLWRTDGTPQGTTLFYGVSPRNLTVLNDRLIFSDNGTGIWSTDGTSGGTAQLANGLPGTSTYIRNFTIYNNCVYFVAANTLWKTDGTAAGTKQVKQTQYYLNLVRAGDKLILSTNSELWRSDGTEGGTVKIKDISSIAAIALDDTYHTEAVTASGDLYFQARSNTANPMSLWKTDGTEAGTIEITDGTFSKIGTIAVAGNTAFFTAKTDALGEELWLTDGTPGGTRLVKDIWPGPYASMPDGLLSVGDFVYFNAYDGAGRTLWKTNGNLCSTLKVTTNTSVMLSPNAVLSLISTTLYSIGWEGGTGAEVFIHDITTDIELAADCRAAQSLLFSAITDKTIGDAPVQLDATATSGLAVSLAPATDNISITNNVVTFNKPGKATIIASQTGNGAYQAATPVEQSFCVNPAKPVITTNAASSPIILTSGNSEGNQWYKNNEAIPGSTDAILHVDESGTYTVRTIVGECSSVMSDNATVVITGIEGGAFTKAIVLYPNPANNHIVFETTDKQRASSIHITNSTGMAYTPAHYDAEQNRIDISNLAPGLYTLQIATAKGVVTTKFVKQ